VIVTVTQAVLKPFVSISPLTSFANLSLLSPACAFFNTTASAVPFTQPGTSTTMHSCSAATCLRPNSTTNVSRGYACNDIKQFNFNIDHDHDHLAKSEGEDTNVHYQ
jgi:hypothetical protein